MKTAKQQGYTILELLIVLSVSVGMFGIVATTFGGRQQQVQFTQGVRDFDSRLKDLKNDVSLGYYPANDSITCRATGSPLEPRVNPGVADDIGSNVDCISIGKVLQFSPGAPNEFNTDDDQIMKIFNVVGLRRDANGNNPTTIVDAVPTATPAPEQALLKWGLKVKRVMYTNDPLSETTGIALFSELNRGSQFQSSASNEAVQSSLMPSTVAAGLNESDMISAIRSIDSNINNGIMDFNNTSPIVICVTDADDQRKATITFGGSMSGSIIDFDNYDATVCA